MNIFEKIINNEITADIIYEDDFLIAFYDINPKAPGHFLVVPKKRSTNLIDIFPSDYNYLMKKARELALREIKLRNLNSFNLVINNGKEAGQEVFRTHVHIIPRKS